MIDWAARMRRLLAQRDGGGTAKTDETRVLSVSSVQGGGANQLLPRLSSVSSVGVTAGFAIDFDAAGKVVPVPSSSGNPYMTPEQGDECHEGGWNDAEIETFMARTTRFSAMCRVDAEHLAERLTLRDRQADDRRLCVECRELEASGHCAAARRGTRANTNRQLEATQSILVRCPAFSVSDPHQR